MKPNRLLLVGWDAAEWRIIQQLLGQGLMPNVAQLIARGSSGTIAARKPLLSVSGWATIATGLHASDHRLLNASEVSPHHGGLQPVRRCELKAPTFWSLAAAAGWECHVINFPATHPSGPTGGVSISNYFALAETIDLERVVYPANVLPELKALRVRPEEIDSASILSFVPRAAEVDRQRDGRLAYLISALAHTATVHAAATWALENRPWDLAAICYSGLHQMSHAFMPYHPPRRSHVAEKDFEIYRGVVTAAYRFHDMMLGRLLELAGSQTNVMIVSDHGFHSDEQRPVLRGLSEEAMVMWHRPRAALIAAGPDIPAASHVSGSLLDIAPSVLELVGVAAPDQMPGRPLFKSSMELERVTVPPVIEEPAVASVPAGEADETIAYLKTLGYAEGPDRHAEIATWAIDRSRRYYLAIAHLDVRREREAIALLTPLCNEEPNKIEYPVALAHAYAGARLMDDCRKMTDGLALRFPDDPQARIGAGIMALAGQRAKAAIDHLRAAEEAAKKSPAAHPAANSTQIKTSLGHAYLRLRLFYDALRVLQGAVAEEPDSAEAQSGLSSAALGTGDADLALRAARAAVRLRPDQASHLVRLAAAQRASGEESDARITLEQALELSPDSPLVLRRLAAICQNLGDAASARDYDRRAHLALFNQRLATQRQATLDKAQSTFES